MVELAAWFGLTILGAMAIFGSIHLLDIATDIWRHNKIVAAIASAPFIFIVFVLLYSIVWVVLHE